jgi:transcriptional regulator with XRE-family HTH domain
MTNSRIEHYDRAWLARKRGAAGLTQAQAAEAAKISQGLYCRLEGGVGKPGIVPGLLLAKTLDFDPNIWLTERRLS